MSFGILVLIVLAGLGGPLLGVVGRRFIPVVVGEILGGVLVGPAVLGAVDPTNGTISTLGEIGFAMLMLSVGMHLPLRDRRLASCAREGGLLAAIVCVLALPARACSPRASPGRATRRSTRSCSRRALPPCCCLRSRKRVSRR